MPTNFVLARAAHGTLGDIDPNAPDGVRYRLAETIELAPDLSSYTIRLRAGERFTDGSPVTAQDVAYSLPRALAKNPTYAELFGGFDLANARVDGDRTLVIPTKQPFSDGRALLCSGTAFIVKDGTKEFTVRTPSCGPFRLIAFEPGRGAQLVAHDGFGTAAGNGGPYLDGVEINWITDPDARLNALRGGQVDFAHDLSPVGARTLEGDPRLRIAHTVPPDVYGLYFQLNMAMPPFTDVRVRQAIKLAIDREAMLETVLYGRGMIGNDMLCVGFREYASEIEQRPYDPGRARALLREAGVEGFATTLLTGPESAGMIEIAQLFAEQMRAVGIIVTVEQKPRGQLLADFEAYAAAPIVGGVFPGIPLVVLYLAVFAAGNPFAKGWNRPDVDSVVARGRASRSSDEARRALVSAQRELWESGNLIVPLFKPVLSGQVPGLTGIKDGLFETHPSFLEASLR
ncbi:ABC transporter substrate-binding protein [Tenggerimyces flavus]|uniref:ABC transporter substrate-binding protein n=1 Tax=Tenggerimyces flavus TaxID=1708749 RepID=A0ABV7YPR6_9ACTN|nr:peptide/nickel transport system substrate-binding protein [Tenggerimyces flavus]